MTTTHADALAAIEYASTFDLSEADLRRFWSKVNKTESCWLWQGALRSGYGNFHINDGGTFSYPPAHRISYFLSGKEIQPTQVIDHICRVRNCVNPDHLRAVTSQENTLAGIGPSAINARKTHCIHGHEFTPENTYINTLGRACRTCLAIRDKERRQAEYADRGYPSKRTNHDTCKNGLHPWPESRVLRGQKRRCLLCEREGSRRKRARRKARRAAALALADLAAHVSEGGAK